MKFGSSLAKWGGVWLILLLLACYVVTDAQPKRTLDFYNLMMKLPSDELCRRGEEYRLQPGSIDSALVCYSIVSNRVDNAKTTEDKKMCVKSFVEMAYIHYFHLYDYPQAFTYMTNAEELAQEWNLQLSEIPLYYGLMYESISQQSNDLKTSRVGFDYLRKAFNLAYELNDPHNANLAYSNILNLAHTLNLVDSIKPENELFMKIVNAKGDNSYYGKFNTYIFNGLLALEQGRYDEALSEFSAILDFTPDEQTYSRYAAGVWQLMANVDEARGDYDAAIQHLKAGMKVADKYNIKDAKVEFYRQMADDAAKLNRLEDKYHYQNEYLALKDSVLNYQQVASIDEVRFIGDIRKVENALQDAERHNNRLKMYGLISLIILVVVLGAAVIVVRKNRQLKRSNESLYQKNVEVIQAEEHERKLRNRFQRELDELRQHIAADEQPAADDEDGDDKPVKYAASSLTDDDKEKLADKIRDVLETNEEIYSTDFSAERLAVLIGEKYKYLSQTINELYGCNFNTLLNNYRIREACKRITDTDRYGNLTLEALSLSVGFKSRSTFVLQFKRVTGLTPSQYLAEARRS